MAPAEVALDLLEQLFPLILDAVSKAIEAKTDPLQATKAVLDGEEAAAIVREMQKFGGSDEGPTPVG